MACPGVAVLAESHISIHTWPDAGYAALDVFMCGKADPDACIPVLAGGLQGEARRRERNCCAAGRLRQTWTDFDADASRRCERRSFTFTRRRLCIGMPASWPAKRWIPETLFDELGFRMTYEVERVLYEMQTEHQHLVLFEHQFFGKMLMLDGATQVTTRDEFIYHEMMTHVPILAHGKAREVLIVGGGDCGIAEEVLKHKSVERLTQVEIDASVVRVLQGAFSGIHQAGARPTSASIWSSPTAWNTSPRPSGASTSSSSIRPIPQGPGKVLFSQQILRRLQALHDSRRRAW